MSDEITLNAVNTTDDYGRTTAVIHNSVLQLLGMFYEDERVTDATIMSAIIQAAATLAHEAISRAEGKLTKEYFLEAFGKAIDIAEFNKASENQSAGPRGDV